jgi:hypothetical protein
MEGVRDVIREGYRQADHYGLIGPARLDFFYLHERTRRWASGSLGSQKGIAIAPFLTPGYIRAAFAYPGTDKASNPFHRHIIATHAPRWVDVPYAHDVRQSDRHDRREASHRAWLSVAEPTVREALADGGAWTELFSPDLVAEHWPAAPDQIAIAHLLDETVESTRAAGA